MIEWKVYKLGSNKDFEQKHYLVTNGCFVASAVPSVIPDGNEDWVGEDGYISGVTHYAEINLPNVTDPTE